ncbi:multiple epidermal growth factor-like domains protein 11, partial [Saccostrea cucullata]|uniref:multiple epidermal growth factor-like domains protein 11 n=1 Tax=Saccostrea cuccullata TaxID=36930 RepID=UPI002ED053AF
MSSMFICSLFWVLFSQIDIATCCTIQYKTLEPYQIEVCNDRVFNICWAHKWVTRYRYTFRKRCCHGYKESLSLLSCLQCDNNRYGPECNMICGKCGNAEQCNHVNGSCPNGCDVGVQGNKCDQECDGGTFGLNCAQSCGVCLDKEQCHHVNGSCLNGCDRGYQGDNCTQ